ncbi:biotin carboxylase N-terminal domain-containing protein [Ramlibacter sp. PS3R-8]|uniref:acetyl/propionyl/methylcrotonyl-CoA carboxylase subunit alpha n=1 Tax=Ramlibacter sp. PS3R-8 TaxID=3133437 RepID=UPI0030B15444
MRRLLIANRGEIARRVMRTAHALGIETVAVYSQPDAAALHVREATTSVALGGDASADSYLRIDKILAAARFAGADALHPGYGFLSENAEFAQAVEDAGLTWIGPPAEAIRTLGNKSRAKDLAQARGVPCLPGYQGADQSEVRLLAEARDIGFPLMVKAASGGGGRGMRLVTEDSQLRAALQGARSEALSAFGSGELLLEQALSRPRHVEVQVFADMHGNCLHLGERDCSVQRRHQKIIEETPSPAVDASMRQAMGKSAVELARSAGYLGAGTVEFLVDEDGAFYLMEMNTRLQVEHTVTEMVAGLDLVEWQLRVACGERLPFKQSDLRLQGHAIEVRLCAEDEDFVPHTGTVVHFLPPPGIRFDHAICPGLEVSPHYDSMLGKLIVHAPTRAEAISRLATALDRLQILGVPTNRRFLSACLRHPLFGEGLAQIPFLAEHGDAIRRQLQEEEFGVAAEAAFSALLPQGGAPALPSPFTRPLRIRHRDTLFDVPLCEADGVAPGQAQVAVLGAGRWHVQSGAVDLFLDDASFDPPAAAGGADGGAELRAPFNGKVIALHVQPGDEVRKGDPLVTLESMKLEHVLSAQGDGIVDTVEVQAGQQVLPSQVLVTVGAA